MSKMKKYVRPKTVEEAVKVAHDCGDDFSFIAGGTDVIVNKMHGNNSSSCLIDLSAIDDMKQINRNGKHLKIGAAVTLDNLIKNSDIVNEFPLLVETSSAVATPVIRKTATIGGNILCENRCIFYNQTEWWRNAVGYCLKCDGDVCIATGGKKNCFSKFVSDMAIALISMNACVEVVEYSGGYVTRLEDIYSRNGVNPLKLKKTALIKAIHLPIHEEFRSRFKKLRQREGMDFGSLTTAISINKHEKIKIVLGCIDPGPIVIEGHQTDDKQELIKMAVKKSRIVDNDVYSREYRKEMITVFLNRSFKELQL